MQQGECEKVSACVRARVREGSNITMQTRVGVRACVLTKGRIRRDAHESVHASVRTCVPEDERVQGGMTRIRMGE